MKRLLWIDISKGLAILVVAYFHFFRTYFQYGVLPPADWSNLAASALTILRLIWFKVSGLGFHAVGVFIILSGWTLMQSTMRRVESGPVAWGGWYRSRLECRSLCGTANRARMSNGFYFAERGSSSD